MQQLGPGVPGPGERQLRRFPGTDPGVRVLCSCPRFISKAQGTFPLSGLPLIPRAHGGPRLGPGRGPQKRGPGCGAPSTVPCSPRGQGRAHLCGSGFLVLENVLRPPPLCAATAPLRPRRPGDVPTRRASTLRSSRDDTRPEPAPPERRTTPFPQTSPVRSAGVAGEKRKFTFSPQKPVRGCLEPLSSPSPVNSEDSEVLPLGDVFNGVTALRGTRAVTRARHGWRPGGEARKSRSSEGRVSATQREVLKLNSQTGIFLLKGRGLA